MTFYEIIIFAITSIPCFEFWILLHFEYTIKQYDIGTGSICANVIADLKAYMPRYSKGDEDIYQATKDQLETAITNSKKVVRHCETGGTDMPSTKVHELVEYLKNLKAQF